MIPLKFVKKLIFGHRFHGGRSKGLITAPRRSALTKRNYRFLDTKRVMFPGETSKLLIPYLYDPNRSGFISLLMYPNGIFGYVLAVRYQDTQKMICNLGSPVHFRDTGYSKPLHALSKGLPLTSIGFTTRAAGNSAVLLNRRDNPKRRYTIRLSSGEYRLFNGSTPCVVGVVSNEKAFLKDLERAGATRLRHIRPRVRAYAMNPVDHPMGGRTSGGCQPVSSTGKLALGVSTSSKRKPHFLTIVTARRSRGERIS